VSRRFLDTNIFLRHLTNDDPERSPRCLALFRAIEHGEVTAWTSDMVIAEVVFVLGSRRTYNLPRDRIRDLLLPLIYLPRKRLYGRIFELYVTQSIDYVDAYHAALIERRAQAELHSYDTDFDRLPTVRRVEPGSSGPGL
jgi:predicted nucleic acid-binding protein